MLPGPWPVPVDVKIPNAEATTLTGTALLRKLL
jgi:hypothetical protein